MTTFNKSYPLVRFGTGDAGALAPVPEEQCNQQLLGLFGRTGEAIKVRGMFLHPNRILAAVERLPQIKHAQAIITRSGNQDILTIKVELHPNEPVDDIGDALKGQIQSVARLRVDTVEVVEAGVIDPGQRMVRDERTWE